MKILVLNSGSSSIKFRLLDLKEKRELASGLIERIGEAGAKPFVSNHREGLELIVNGLVTKGPIQSLAEITAIGHRVVHGGEKFREPVLIDSTVLAVIREMKSLAPLHNPANLLGIEVAREICPTVPQVAVFDTAFHQTMPEMAYRYAIPKRFYESLRIRRYGFHGTSHRQVADQAAQALGRSLSTCNLITLHLGNGASACAIRDGQSVDTTMGFTPLEGLVMGTRSGDIDPSLPFILTREEDIRWEDVESILNKESGLKGICGVSDMREIERLAREGDKDALLALELFCYRIRKTIGSYVAVLGRVDALVFTGGIGENSAHVRELCCRNLDALGFELDSIANENSLAHQNKMMSSNPHADSLSTFHLSTRSHSISTSCFDLRSRVISSVESRSKIFVIAANEELEIAQQTANAIGLSFRSP